MEISKFPPQHRNKCYCQTKADCLYYMPNGKKRELHNSQSYFIKSRRNTNHNPKSLERQQHARKFIKTKSHHATTSLEENTTHSFPNQLKTISSNHGTNPISQSVLHSKTSCSDQHHLNPTPYNNYHTADITNPKMFNVIYDRYEKLREIETFRAENANECISVLNQQTNHHRVPNKSAVKHVCQHRYRYLMEPIVTNGRGESKCELCEKWRGLDRLKSVISTGNCEILDKSDSSDLLICDETDDCKIILEVQNLNISADLKTTKAKQPKNKIRRSWHLMEQAKSLALVHQRRY